MRDHPSIYTSLVYKSYRSLSLAAIAACVSFFISMDISSQSPAQGEASLITSAQAKKKRKKRKKRYNRRQREAQKLIDAGHPVVELNLQTSPNVRASVYHGKELLGTTPMRLTWPKDTGALDLKLKAKGYLTVNTRLYTYRNDRATVKMFKIDEAHKLFGYKKKVKSATEEGQEN